MLADIRGGISVRVGELRTERKSAEFYEKHYAFVAPQSFAYARARLRTALIDLRIALWTEFLNLLGG